MENHDLVVSLGPDCRTTWNVRKWFGIEKAYPFDWWITPTKSMLRMIDPAFEFRLTLDDIQIVRDGDSVYNRYLNILHHHDFPRDPNTNQVVPIDPKVVEGLENKFRYLFERFRDAVEEASSPLFIVSGVYPGWHPQTPAGDEASMTLNGLITPEGLASEIQQRLGEKCTTIVVTTGNDGIRQFNGGAIASLPDDGSRCLAEGHWAEPVNVFRSAFETLGLPENLSPSTR